MQIVAGSMRDAFGIRDKSKKASIVEIDGVPIRDYVKHVAEFTKKEDTDFADEAHDEKRKQGPEASSHDVELSKKKKPDYLSSLTAASLRQAMQQHPEIAEIADQIVLEETEDGLDIQLLDQEGRSMFPEGSKQPHEHTRHILRKLAPFLRSLPNRIAITGHTDSKRSSGQSDQKKWELSSARANIVRSILAREGIPNNRFFAVIGKADNDPLFIDNASMPANRRISITIMSEVPPILPQHGP